MGVNPFYRQLSAPQPAGCVPISQAGGTPCTVPGVTPGFQGQPTTGISTFPFVANGANFPWTTGTIRVFDDLGNFTTTRTRTGTDLRNAAGTTGTLQLVNLAQVLRNHPDLAPDITGRKRSLEAESLAFKGDL